MDEKKRELLHCDYRIAVLRSFDATLIEKFKMMRTGWIRYRLTCYKHDRLRVWREREVL